MVLAEIALAMFNSPNPLGAKVGSIVASRVPRDKIGDIERKLYVWIYVDGLSRADIETLGREEFSSPEELIVTQKYRFFIETDRLKDDLGAFDVLRAMDKSATYQPAVNFDERTGKVTGRPVLFSATALAKGRSDNAFFRPERSRG